MAKLGIGLVGCGEIGMVHAKRLVNQEDGVLVGVRDVSTEAANRAGAELGVPASSSYSDFLARPEVEAVLIATPNFSHYDMAMQAIAAGKHVLLEKPMAKTVRECDDLIQAAEAKGVKLMVGQVLRLMPPFIKVREMVSSGEFGAPRMGEVCRFSWWRGANGPRTWRSSKEMVWGMLYESSIHELDLLRSICGEVEEVQAVCETVVHTDRDTEDTAIVILRFQNGAIGLVRGSSACAVPTSDGKIMCERGTIAFDWRKLRIESRREDEEKTTVLDLRGEDFEDGYAHEQRSFIEWVLFDRQPVFTARDGRAAIELCEAAYLSTERHAPVSLPLLRA